VRVDRLSLGVMARSDKENERRQAIHPQHLERIDPRLRERLYLERGYGERFGVPDAALAPLVAGLRSPAELIAGCDIVLQPKPQLSDLADMRPGQVLWGWPHCVQDADLTQIAIDRRLTLVAFEAMNEWTESGAFSRHVFATNNELAGYCSVLHALALTGLTGRYGRLLSAAVISLGSAGRGAVTALAAHGVTEIDIVTHRAASVVNSPVSSARVTRYAQRDDDPARAVVMTDAGEVPMAEFLASRDIVVNCVLQDTDAPQMFVSADELSLFPSGRLIVDVSCDAGMGFAWALPTPFTEPMFTVGDNVAYYAVDHSPSYLWNSATWEISEGLLPYLPAVMGGPDGWDGNETVRRSIEIRDGVIQNPAILRFQNRDADYPHPRHG
jgi:alanine dehydrogenase